ncbi:hypothetical protein H4Q26_001258 [Puccinia striiformis f. sp. tritici PST-130]|nr:hypothetical protein H4Q26_001258 [Puccinia striiformis f. sp. tritici PST-130]
MLSTVLSIPPLMNGTTVFSLISGDRLFIMFVVKMLNIIGSYSMVTWIRNGVLGNNKLLTLPNGEQLNLPINIQIMFRVESLKHATLAIVSCCGMVWFSEDAVTPDKFYKNYLKTTHDVALDAVAKDLLMDTTTCKGDDSGEVSENHITQRLIINVLSPYF